MRLRPDSSNAQSASIGGEIIIRREFNPFSNNGSPLVANRVLEEILLPGDVKVRNANCLTLHIKPDDMGYNIGFTVNFKKEAGELIEIRGKYPGVGRISEFYSRSFNEESMIEFFKEYRSKIATTIGPAIIMACVQHFGEDFLEKLPYKLVRP